MTYQILEQGIPESSSSEEFSSEHEYIHIVGHMYPVSKEYWNKAKEYRQEVDNLTENYGDMPTSEHILEIPNFKGITHQRRDNARTSKSDQ